MFAPFAWWNGLSRQKRVGWLLVGASTIWLLYFMKTLLSAIFKREVTVRLRPGFFPFVEPGFELDIQCLICNGAGCPVCKQSGWVELLPCGLVHPNVLRNCGLNPDEYQGFAWGMGIDRIAMLKYGMPDLRAFFEADVRWLAHYGFRPLDFPTLAGGLSS